MKKIIAGLMVAAAMLTFGCSGRNAAFGVVDMRKVETEAAVIKTTKEDVTAKMKELKEQMDKDMAGKQGEEASKIAEDYSAKAQLVQSEAQNKLKASLDTALNQVAKEKNLGAIMIKEAVPQGGTDVTKEVIEKMK
ncbi:OmpH family outer membrane protein [uncultured Phascolarctobacterium sp.]|uniref:OmpH family outer membrane protein n=1 Tax=uncultured Phascolarctobacterium sp. TaxID=512296 RepID=UPI00261052A4|nr:OmpH family outer membrane protein [uncultured Phascolarctobacterium sp.]